MGQHVRLRHERQQPQVLPDTSAAQALYSQGGLLQRLESLQEPSSDWSLLGHRELPGNLISKVHPDTDDLQIKQLDKTINLVKSDIAKLVPTVDYLSIMDKI